MSTVKGVVVLPIEASARAVTQGSRTPPGAGPIGTKSAPTLATVKLESDIEPASVPVFQQDWWLEIVRQKGNYREAQVFKDHVLIGRLPYVVRRTKIGMLWGASPDWSHLGGPILSQALIEQEKSDVLARLIAQLPAHISYGFVCSPYAHDAALIRRAFTEAGFSHFSEETYCERPTKLHGLDRLKRKHRLRLEAARRAIDMIEISPDEFTEFYSVNLVEAGLPARRELKTARDLIVAGRAQNPPQVKIFAAKRKASAGPLDAAIACAWDRVRSYYWMSTRRPRDSHPDAIKLLLLDAMAHARSLGLVFDTDGCSTPGSEILYRDVLRMGHRETRDAYERITKLQRWYIILQLGLDKFSAVQYARRRLKLIPSVWVPGRLPPAKF